MQFIQTNYFEYKPEKLFDGIITDIPYKGSIANKLGEKEFDIDLFLTKTYHETIQDSFLITFCNFLCAMDIIMWCKTHNLWQYHCYGIWNKSNARNWISWQYPLRTCEFILFLKKGKFEFCFKTGQTTLPTKRKAFGGKLKTTKPNTNPVEECMYEEIFTFKSPSNKIHPTQKPDEFSSIFAKIIQGKDKYICDPCCGSGKLLKVFPNSIGIDIKKY
jgi:DNA modification methylase